MRNKIGDLWELFKQRFYLNNTGKLSYMCSKEISEITMFLGAEITNGRVGKYHVELYKEIRVISNELYKETGELKSKYYSVMKSHEKLIKILHAIWVNADRKDKVDIIHTANIFYQISREMNLVKNEVTLSEINSSGVKSLEDELNEELLKVQLQVSQVERERQLKELFKEKRLTTYDEVRKEISKSGVLGISSTENSDVSRGRSSQEIINDLHEVIDHYLEKDDYGTIKESKESITEEKRVSPLQESYNDVFLENIKKKEIDVLKKENEKGVEDKVGKFSKEFPIEYIDEDGFLFEDGERGFLEDDEYIHTKITVGYLPSSSEEKIQNIKIDGSNKL